MKQDRFDTLLPALERYATTEEVRDFRAAFCGRDWDTCHEVMARFPIINLDRFPDVVDHGLIKK